MIPETIIILILILLLAGITVRYIQLYTRIETHARRLHEKWRDQDMESYKSRILKEAEDTIRREVDYQNRDWRMKEGERIRQDAIRRSRGVIHGKVTEHLIPYFPAFPWNPSDARFLGSPVDFIVFHGLSEGEVTEIILVEVKSGARKVLSPRERSVARCAERGDISFRVIHPDDS
jgi:predicted Holliday junction resolvase-like endonuclease